MAKAVSKALRRATPLGLTPMALSLAACGSGGEDSSSSSNNDIDVPSMGDSEGGSGGAQYTAIEFTSTRIDYDVAGFTSFEINQVASGGSDSKVFLANREVGNLIITPHQDSLIPDANGINRYFPLIEYTLNDGRISIHRVVDDFDFVGSKPVDELIVNGSQAILFGGTGPEYTDGRDWPFGALWVAKIDQSSDIEYLQVTTDNAFYHGISSGDINGDGLDDIVAVHMGAIVLDGPTHGNVHFFLQSGDGSFNRELLYDENPSLNGGSSILVSDLDGDGESEVLVASYGDGFIYYDVEQGGDFSLTKAPYSFHILKYDAEMNKVKTVSTAPLEGSMVDVGGNGGFGVIDIAEIDFDMDGDDDLLMLLENGEFEFTFELYRNEGSLDFNLVTSSAFERSLFSGEDGVYRNITVTDIQGDGHPDFILSGRNWWGNGGHVDLGQFIYINSGNGSFRSLGGSDDLMLDQNQFDLNGETEVVRTINYLETNNGEVHFLLTQGGITAMDFIDVRVDLSSHLDVLA